jgi:CDP-diglyceride synthetase
MTQFIQRAITGGIFFGTFMTLFVVAPHLLSWALGIMLCYILVTEWHQIGIPLLTPLYPIIPFLLMIRANEQSDLRIYLFITVLFAMAFDTGAYVTGKRWGTHYIVPRISPGKTWEGLIGGIIAGMMMLYSILSAAHITLSAVSFIWVSLILATSSLIGDLFISWLKRHADVKDTGHILPGHGGLLDRFDSILFCSITVYVLPFFITL